MNKRRKERKGGKTQKNVKVRETEWRIVGERGYTQKKDIKIDKQNEGIRGKKGVEKEWSKRNEDWGKIM
jgi:hypothetical protein